MNLPAVTGAFRRLARRREHAAYRSAAKGTGLLPACGSSVRPLALQRRQAPASGRDLA
jgi:hypothetical protein